MDTNDLPLAVLHRLDLRMNRIADDLGDMLLRLTPIEAQIGHLVEPESLTSVLDRVEQRLERMERRLHPPPYSPFA